MELSILTCVVLALALQALAALAETPQQIVAKLQKNYEANTKKLLEASNSECNPETVMIRQAWDDLSDSDRLDYIDAVKCLNSKTPARTPSTDAPGARNWRDDFVYIHINQTNFIHGNGRFFPWHRQFIWSWENTLRTECGYTGSLPYWPWERTGHNQSAAQIFQPTPTSFGSDGEFIPHTSTVARYIQVPSPIVLHRPAGAGGGCLQDGPFKNDIINIGPVSPGHNAPDNRYGYDYNPRCITRDFVQSYSSEALTWSNLSDVLSTKTISEFQPLAANIIHANAHGFIGGAGFDLYSSPNDPVFFLLHAQVDRIWSLWQGQDYKARMEALHGTLTVLNDPPSEKATLDTIMTMGIPAGGDLPIRHSMSTIEKEYCYMYV